MLFDGHPDASAIVVRPDGYVFGAATVAELTRAAQGIVTSNSDRAIVELTTRVR